MFFFNALQGFVVFIQHLRESHCPIIHQGIESLERNPNKNYENINKLAFITVDENELVQTIAKEERLESSGRGKGADDALLEPSFTQKNFLCSSLPFSSFHGNASNSEMMSLNSFTLISLNPGLKRAFIS